MTKKLLVLSFGVCLLAAMLAGCEGDSKDAAKGGNAPKTAQEAKNDPKAGGGGAPAAAKPVTDYKEAPMLQQLAKAGSLPPVKDRLPAAKDIMIEKVQEEIGQYGGDWRLPWKGIDDKWESGKTTEEALFRFTQDGKGLEPNVAKSYEVNADATEYIIRFREGMKWSDGKPFTADDVIFYWEHMLLKETFGKKLYDCYYSVDPKTGEKARAEVVKVDDYTVKITHKYPSVLFLERLAIDNKWFYAPAHFYKTILPEFIGEEKALEEAKKWGFNDLKNFGSWTGYYYWVWPQRPTLRPWVAKNDPNSDRHIMERNPYYWKTDPEGNQLPYIDRIVFDKKQDDSHFLLEGLAGNVDAKFYNFKDFTVLKENEKKGNYRVLKWNTAEWSSNTIQLNQTAEDPKLRALFQDIRFREALSVAVDRGEVSEIVTNGLAEPGQASVPKGLANYQEGWAQKWAKYDVNRANQLLDEIGLKWDAAHKFRTHPDGSELQFIIYQESTGDAKAGKFQELLKKYYEAVGLQTIIKIVDKSLYHELKYGNKLTAATENTSMLTVSLRPDTLVPLRTLTPWYGFYGQYNQSKGKEGVKPEGDVAKLLEFWDKLVASKNSAEINQWSEEIIKLHQKNQWLIGYTGPLPALLLVKNNMKNVPGGLVESDEFRSLGHARPQQFFFKK